MHRLREVLELSGAQSVAFASLSQPCSPSQNITELFFCLTTLFGPLHTITYGNRKAGHLPLQLTSLLLGDLRMGLESSVFSLGCLALLYSNILDFVAQSNMSFCY
jgi:hypothetical protein